MAAKDKSSNPSPYILSSWANEAPADLAAWERSYRQTETARSVIDRAARKQNETLDKILECLKQAVRLQAEAAQASPTILKAPPRLLSEEKIAEGWIYYEALLDGKIIIDKLSPERWRHQSTAAKHITVKFYDLPESSWQTIQSKIVVPVLEKRGLKKPRTSGGKK